MATQRVDARVERRVRSLGRLGRQRAGHQRRFEQQFRLEQPGQRIGIGELRAVEQRQSFLRAKLEDREPCLIERGARRNALVAHPDFADPDHRRRHVRQRREIAARADRALARDDRGQALVEHRLEQGDRLRLHARCPLPQARQLQCHHQPDDRHGRRRAGAGRMAQHDVALERCEIVIADPHARQFPKAGVDPIDRRALGEDARDRSGALGDARCARRVEPRRGSTI
ncbi:hypothetical protein D9M73_124000 [compost metagenome]